MSKRDEESHGGGLQSWNTSERNLPMVVLAPPEPEAAATRGVTGIFVLLVLIVGLGVAVLYFVQALESYQRYEAAKQITRDAEGLMDYVNRLQDTNETMIRRRIRLPAPDPHPLQTQINSDRAAYDAGCEPSARREQDVTYCLRARPCTARQRVEEQNRDNLDRLAASRGSEVYRPRPFRLRCDTVLPEFNEARR